MWKNPWICSTCSFVIDFKEEWKMETSWKLRYQCLKLQFGFIHVRRWICMVCVCVWVGCGPQREVHKVRIWKFLLSGQNSETMKIVKNWSFKKEKKFSSRFCSDFFGPITKMLVTCWHYIRWYHTTDWCVSHGVSPGASHMSRVSTCCSVCTDLLRCHS